MWLYLRRRIDSRTDSSLCDHFRVHPSKQKKFAWSFFRKRIYFGQSKNNLQTKRSNEPKQTESICVVISARIFIKWQCIYIFFFFFLVCNYLLHLPIAKTSNYEGDEFISSSCIATNSCLNRDKVNRWVINRWITRLIN